MAKKSKRKPKEVRAAPTEKRSTVSWVTIDDFNDLCCSDYVRLGDNPEVLSAVNKICDIVSSITIYQMENTDKGDIRIKDGLSRLVDIAPNPYMTRKTFIFNIVKSLLLDGNGNSVVIPKTSGGYIEKLDIVAPSRVTFMKDGYYAYKILIDGIAKDPADLLHFVINPSPEEAWLGTGYKAALKDVAKNLKQALATERGFMESKWKPSIIVKVDSMVDELSTEKGRQEILKSYVKTSEAGEPWLLPAEQFDVEVVKPLSLNDIALSDSVKLDKQTVASILSVPPFIVGIGEYKASEWDNFINARIKPICNAIEQELTRVLLISPTRYFKFNLRSIYSYDIKVLAEVGTKLYERGVMTGNEVRDMLSFSPLDGLDELHILENYIPINKIGEQNKLNGGE